jgi:threonyl-tRNA synthetase
MIVKLPDGRIVEHPGPAALKDVLATTNKELLATTVGAKLDGEIVDFHRVLPDSAQVELIPLDSPEGVTIYRHSCSHIMAQAVRRLFPGVKLAIGPAIEDGFYYDFDYERSFTPEDLEKIEAEMKKIVQENYPFERFEVSKAQARAMLQDEPYKLELLEEIPEETVSFYRDGDFVDLCRGPHMLSTGQVKHFKLLSVAGAYWRGDEKNKMLQRIYGTAFATKEALEKHLQMLEEAKKRDHRKLGRELELFFFDEEVGPGLPLWLPKGAIIIEELEKLAKETEAKAGYLRVRTPPHLQKSLCICAAGICRTIKIRCIRRWSWRASNIT